MTSHRSRLCVLIASLGLLGCRPPVSSEVPDTPGQDAPDTARAAPATVPRQVLLPWDTHLFLQAQEGSSWVLRGDASRDGPGRVVRVIEREGDYWRISTRSEDPLEPLDPPIELLEVYALEMYVKVDEVEPIDPVFPSELVVELAEGSRSAPMQSGLARPAGEQLEWEVPPGAEVFWPSGDPAGRVVMRHAFSADEARARAGELRCFGVALGPRGSGEGTLCFAEEAFAEGPEPQEFRAWDEPEPEPLAIDLDEVGALAVLLGPAEGYGEISAFGSEPGEEMELVEGEGAGKLVLGVREHEDLGEPEVPLPTVLAEDFVIEGPEPLEAQRVVELRLRSVAECAAQAQARGRALPASLALALSIGAEGKVERAELEGEVEALLGGCIERAAKRWRFKSQAPGVVRSTLVFAK